MKNINQFTKGDFIVRLEPAKEYRSGLRDRSYLGEKLTYIGCANGNIYLEREQDSFMSKVLGDVKLVLSADLWNEGWDYWVNPDDLFSEKPVLNLQYLQSQLDKAVMAENYEEAEKIRKQMEQL